MIYWHLFPTNPKWSPLYHRWTVRGELRLWMVKGDISLKCTCNYTHIWKHNFGEWTWIFIEVLTNIIMFCNNVNIMEIMELHLEKKTFTLVNWISWKYLYSMMGVAKLFFNIVSHRTYLFNLHNTLTDHSEIITDGRGMDNFKFFASPVFGQMWTPSMVAYI